MKDRRAPMPALGRLWPLAAVLALLSCGPSEEVVGAPSEAVRAAPPPRLGETAAFDAALARAGPDAERLEASKGELAARAEALRARAAGLSAPVVDPAVRPRLEPPAAAPAGE